MIHVEQERAVYYLPNKYDVLNIFLCLQNTRPYIITLNAGDVLFVPRHWWHFVYTHSESSISINTWLEMVRYFPFCGLEDTRS